MAGNDVFLYSVPSDPDSDDVRLRDPTTSGAPAGDVTVTASQTLADLVQEVDVDVVVSVTSAQTLADVSQSAEIDVTISAVAAQTLEALTQSADIDVTVSVVGAQLLEDVAQSTAVEVVPVGDVTVTASQTLEDVGQSASVHIVSATADLDSGWNDWELKRRNRRRAAATDKQKEIADWLRDLRQPVSEPIVTAIPVVPIVPVIAASARQVLAGLVSTASVDVIDIDRIAEAAAGYRRSRVDGAVLAFTAAREQRIATAARTYRISQAVSAYKKAA